MNKKLLGLTPKRYLCPYCGEWHDWELSHILGYYDSPARKAKLKCEKQLYGCRPREMQVYFSSRYCYYRTIPTCSIGNLDINDKIPIEGIFECSTEPRVKFSVPFIADNYRRDSLVLGLSKSAVHKAWTEGRLVWCCYKNQIIKVTGKKLRAAAFYIPAEEGIAALFERNNLSLAFIEGIWFYLNQVTRCYRIIVFLFSFYNLSFNCTVAGNFIITLNCKKIICSCNNSALQITLLIQSR